MYWNFQEVDPSPPPVLPNARRAPTNNPPAWPNAPPAPPNVPPPPLPARRLPQSSQREAQNGQRKVFPAVRRPAGGVAPGRRRAFTGGPGRTPAKCRRGPPLR